MKRYLPITFFIFLNAVPILCNASLESSMYSLRSQLSGVFLPVLALMGIVLSGISLAFGNQNAKSHVMMAVGGTVLGFGADSIIEFVRRTFGS